jgi:uncharacterized protein YcfJ
MSKLDCSLKLVKKLVKTAKKHWREVGMAAATLTGIVLGGFIGHRAGRGDRGHVVAGVVVGGAAGFALPVPVWLCVVLARREGGEVYELRPRV